MIVDLFSTVLDGGPGLAARRLHAALRGHGVESRFWYAQPSTQFRPDTSFRRVAWSARRPDHWSEVPQWVRHRARWMSLRRAAAQALSDRDENAGFSPWFAKSLTPPRADMLTGDVLHLQWLGRHLDWPSFFAGIPTDLPVVWTLHDMTPLTGGCHHADDCRAFHEQCRYCPLLAQPGPDDLSSLAFAAKQAAYAGRKFHIVTPSRWLEDQVRRSALLCGATSIRTIHPPLDTDTFRPVDKRRARQVLGLDPDCFWIGFAGDGSVEPRLGLVDLVRALREWPAAPRAHLLLSGNSPAPALEGSVFAHHSGPQRDDQRQRLLHAAADVLVASSHTDNLTASTVEAMACGTPVLAYAVGGVDEIVRPGQTGLVARRGDPADLLRQLVWLAEHPTRCRQLGAAARELVAREFDQRRQAAAYVALYEEVLAASRQSLVQAPRRAAA